MHLGSIKNICIMKNTSMLQAFLRMTMLRYSELGCKVHNILIRLEEPAECLGYTLK